jgi:hypothetical protein
VIYFIQKLKKNIQNFVSIKKLFMERNIKNARKKENFISLEGKKIKSLTN